jgi:hypothetical protein
MLHQPSKPQWVRALDNELRASSRWECRLMALETEVHRVKRGRQRVAPTRVRQNYNRKETA